MVIRLTANSSGVSRNVFNKVFPKYLFNAYSYWHGMPFEVQYTGIVLSQADYISYFIQLKTYLL